MSRLVIVLALFLMASVVLSTGLIYYPDGPFRVGMSIDGRMTYLQSDVTLHSVTEVIEHKTGTRYTKSPGTTSYSDITVTPIQQSSDLDNWFNQAAPEKKDIVISIINGRGEVIEAWKIYRTIPLSKSESEDGTAYYTLRSTASSYNFERDRDILPPPNPRGS